MAEDRIMTGGHYSSVESLFYGSRITSIASASDFLPTFDWPIFLALENSR